MLSHWPGIPSQSVCFSDEDGPVPHMNTKSTGRVPAQLCVPRVSVHGALPRQELLLASICERGSVAVPDLAFRRSLKLSPQNPCGEILLACGSVTPVVWGAEAVGFSTKLCLQSLPTP